jgi:hypothetical protein
MARRFPGLRIVAQCPYYHEAVDLGKGPANLSFDISHVETLRTLLSLTGQVPVDRVLYGTHAPFLQSYAALMKLDAPYVTPEVRAAVGSGNARALFGASLEGRMVVHGSGPRVASSRKPAKAAKTVRAARPARIVKPARKPAKKAAKKPVPRRRK